MTSFSKAWRYRCKRGVRRGRRALKNKTNRLNRRNGKRFLDSAVVVCHNAYDVT